MGHSQDRKKWQVFSSDGWNPLNMAFRYILEKYDSY